MKKLLSLFSILICLAILFYPQPSNSYSTGSPGGKTGSPTDGVNCTQCHTAGSGTGATITTNIPSTGYVPGTTYTITATVAQTGINKFGFEITAEKNAGGTKTGTFFVTNSTQTKLVNSNTAITHKSTGTSGTNSKSWSMNWQAPTSGTGAITFHGAYIAANGNGQNTGDTYHSASSTFNEFICNTSAIQTMTGFNPNPVYSASENSFNTLTLTNTSNCAIRVRPEFTISKTNGVISQGDFNIKFLNPYTGFWNSIPYSITANGDAVGHIGYPLADTTGIIIGQGGSIPVNLRVNFTSGTQGSYCATWLTKEVDILGNVIQILTSGPAACLDFVNCNTFSVDNSFSSDITCFNANDGNASILSIQNGSGATLYNWSNGNTTSTANNLTPGNHQCIVIDSNWQECKDTIDFTIIEPAELTSTYTQYNVNCFGGNDGTATVTGSGGTPGYTYLWSNGQTTQTATGLSAGTYTCAITDDNNCQTTASVTIDVSVNPLGCTDPTATNYDNNAVCDDGSCTYCIYGCTYNTQSNYNAAATCDDGSCIPYQFGCMNSTATNYNPSATADDGSCIWLGCTDPTANNYDAAATVDDGSCTYAISGCTNPLACNYNSLANTDDGSCVFQAQTPTVACYETATWNESTCQYDISGTQDPQPTLACYESATFNTTSCAWVVTGTQPVEPTLACYESATFNTTSCAWVVTGTQPVEPTLACYETAAFNTTSCSWLVSGTQDPQPATACYETATFNTSSCSWLVSGTQDPQPATACYETATFNTSSCSWLVSGTQDPQPATACYETATFNTSSCSWVVTGTQPVEPTLACYESAVFNTISCVWDVTGTQPTAPTTACYETATFNTSSCAWVVTGTQPAEPTVACYESATFNTTTCQWVVTGTQPTAPTTACYETATFNTSSCAWVVTGTQPAEPTVACYETATFNTTSCVWDVSGTQPAEPTLACYESATFNTTSCVWDVSGTQPAEPTLACYESATFNTTSCVWDVSGTQPVQPTLACYETATFNTTTCVWDVTGAQITPSGLSTSNIGLTSATNNWGSISNAHHYDIQLRVVGTATWLPVNNLSGTSTSYTITGLTAATNYEWQIRSACSSGNSSVSEWSSSQTFSTTSPPLCIQFGDGNCDNIVNLTDLILVINNWLQTDPVGNNGDIVGSMDGFVNLDDLILVINNWLQSTP